MGGVTLFGGDGNDKLYGYYDKAVRGYASLKADMDDAKARNAGDYLVAGAGNDLLDGGKGVDTLEGGLGNDTIYVDNTFNDGDFATYDKIWEFGYEGDPGNGGTDWVISTVNIDLKDIYTDNGLFDTQLKYVENGMFIENIEFGGNSNLNASGNWLNNIILGNRGNNILSGELADDTLVGDQGNDWLQGGDGKDSLTGVDLTFRGGGEIDQLTGGADADVFVLGDSTDYFYKGYLDDDYALITDAGTGGDTIMLKGVPLNYRIEGASSSRLGGVTGQGVYIYVDNPVPVTGVIGTTGTEDDLIAFLSAPTGSYTLTYMGVA